jgi:hypothetical protein
MSEQVGILKEENLGYIAKFMSRLSDRPAAERRVLRAAEYGRTDE